MSDDKALWEALQSKGKDALLSFADMAKDVYAINIASPSLASVGLIGAAVSGGVESLEVAHEREFGKVASDMFATGVGFMRDGKHIPVTDIYKPVVDVDAERAAFEAWIKAMPNGWDVACYSTGDYVVEEIEFAWQAVLWRASRG